jgi:hypothetical protein
MLRGYRGDTDAARQAQAAALVTIAYEAGAERQAKDPTEVYSAWVEANKLKPSFIAKNADRYWKDFNDAHAKGVEDLRVAREAAEKIFPTLAAEKHGADPADVVQYLRPLDATQQALAFRELAELSKTAGTAGKPWKDAFGELATAGGRVIEDIIRGAGNMIEDVGLMDDTSGQEDAAADQLLIRKLYEVRRGLINPIEKDTLWRKATIGAVESLPYMAAAASGIGLAAITASYTNDAQLNLQEKGIPLDKARGLAMVIGPVQGALDKLQLTMLKKAPGLNLFFQKFNTNAVALAAGRLAGVVAVEVGTELVQDPVVPAAVQELASWWDESIPGVAFSDVWGDIKEQSLDVVMATLPLALLGVGAASVRDIKAADQLSRDPEALGLLGFTPAHIKQIGAAPEGTAAAELKKLWNERAPVTKGDRKGLSYAEAAGVVAGAETEDLSVSGKAIKPRSRTGEPPSVEAMESELNKEAGIVALRRDDNGWSVLFDDGKRVNTGTIGAAYELRAGRMMARTEKEAEGFIAVLDSLHKPGKVTTITGAAVEVEGGQITSTTPEGESTIVEKPEAALAELAAEMELLGVPRAAIGGSNMVRDGVTQITLNKTRKGALTALHESAEAVLKEGKVTDSELKAAAFVGFQLFENARNEADTKTALLLQKISLGKATATETRETMVDLAVANALGQRKDGTRFKAGALTAAVDGAIRANRDPKERRDLGRFRSFLRAVRAYMRAVFSTAAKIGKARRAGEDLEALDVLTDKLLGADPERAAAQDKSHARAVESEVKESFAVEAAEIPLRFDGKQKTFDGDPDLLNYTIMVPGSETTLTVEEGTTPEELQSLAREKIAQFEAGARDRGETFEVEPAFYSAAQRAIETKMPTKASAAQIIGILTNPQSRVKQEELKWSGVVPWLKGQADPVTKEAVLNYFRTDGAVKFEEVTLGGPQNPMLRSPLDHSAATMYAKYQLPGGDNYREVVLAMPEADKRNRREDSESFTSSHFPDVPNYVAHMRLNDRPDAAGEPGLFIEEIQSDRHQQARQKGYKGEGGDTLKPLREAMEEARRKMVEARTAAEASVETGDIRDVSDRKLRQAYSNAWDNLERAEGEYRRAKPEGEIPDAPFRKTWPLQMFKRALRDAVAEGKKWVGWTTGATQGERFDLSKQVEAIRIENISGDGKRLAVMAIQKGRNGWTDIADNVPMEKLGDYIGKDLAKKFAEDLPNKPESQEFRGVDLKVGGEGMKGFYDSILPKEVGAYVKQWGGKVEKGEVSLPDKSKERIFDSAAEAKAWAEANLEDHEYEVQELGDGTFALYDQFTNRQVMADNVAETPIWRVEITPAMAAGVAAGQETFAVEPIEPRKLIRITDKKGRGLMNNQALNRDKLTDDEEAELVDLMDFGLQQPRDVPAGAVFYFTESGFAQHGRLIELLKKAAKFGYVETVVESTAPVVWESGDGQVAIAPSETFSVEAPADSMRANWPDVWKGFPDVQWIGNTNLLTTKGGEKIQVPEYKWPVNRDWYVAKGHSGAGPTTPEEQEAAADALITRVIDADPENRQRAAAMLAFVRKHPDAILVPVRGQEKPNKHANLIPGQLARRLSRAAGNAVDETIYKVNTEGNTGKRAAERLFQPHEFAGTVEPGAKYILVDDVSTTGATAYYAARFIEGNGGRLAGVVQIGLTPRLKGEGAFSPKAFAGDEQTLRMTDATRKQLQTKAPDATLNAVVQAHGLADDWHELTDGLGRALAGNWRRASEVLAGGTAGGSALRGETGGGSVAGERPRFKSDAPKARRLTQPTLAGFESFSVEAAGMLERLADDIGRRITNPKEKLDAYARAREKFLGMARSVRFNDSVADAVTKSAIDKERRARQATREEELLNEVEADFGDLTGTEFMAAALNNPIMDAIFRKIPGRKIPAPRLRSRSAALRQGRDIGGDYDGAGELPSWIFGGTIAPDQMAAELADEGLIADAYTDTLWTAIEKALKSAGAAKARLKDYGERKRQAREQAAKEAAAWAKGELAALPERKEQRAKSDLSRFMAALDALLVVFPPEVRAKVGGWTKLATLQTNQARADFIANRIEKIDRVFEEFLQKEYTVRMATLIARANKKAIEAGVKPTSTIGADAHYLLNKMSEAMGMNETEVNGRLADLDSRIASGELTPEQEVLAMREKELVQLAGNWNSREGREAYHRKAYTDKLGKHHPAIDVPAVAEVIGADATRMAAAYLEAERTFDEGWLAWSRKIVARREARAAMRAALIADTGKSGTPVEKDERAEKDLGWRGKLKNVFLGLSSFEEAMTYGYGRESETAREFVDRERAASNAKEDAVQSIGEAVEDLFTRLAGSPFKGTQLQWKLSQKTIDAGAAGKLSELGIVQASLMWRQDDGRRHMEAFGYDAAWMAEQEKQLSNHAKAVRDFLSAQYAAEYAPLNALYRERHGVNLPGHDNYAPLTVTPMQARAGEVVDPVTGQAMGASMLTPGSLRSRSRMATAQPEFRDALQTYLGHVRQLEHWKAYYDLAVDLNAVVGNREVTNATEAAGGEQLTRVLQGWAQLFGQGGNRDAAAFLALNAELGKLSGRAAEMILFGRVGTLLIQGTQLGAALAEMPVSSYVLRMGKLFAGRLSWGDAIRSDYIQRRVSQAPPIVRQAMDALAASKPSRTKHAARQVGKLIPGADALFTAGTYAIVLDYHRSIGRKLGLRGPALDAYATRAAERATDRVAQPTRTGARSFFENTTTAPTLRASWAFASEARQKIALAAWSARSNPAQMARTLAVVWGAGGVMAAMIRAAWRDLKDDDDEDVFDEKNWSLKRLLTSAAAGPLQGVPLVGDIIEGTLFKLTGQFLPSGNMFSQAEAGATGAKKLLTGKAETPEEKLKAAKAVLFTLGLTNDSLAAASTLANIAEDAAKVVDNLEGTD